MLELLPWILALTLKHVGRSGHILTGILLITVRITAVGGDVNPITDDLCIGVLVNVSRV